MNWHRGSIAEAVAESKAKNSVFVVFIEGKDELSTKLERFVDDVRVRSRLETAEFVAIKVQGNSSAYGQFMSLYKVVPVPSLFFIGKSGTPLEIATGITDSVEELLSKIDRVLVLAGKRTETLSVTSSVTSLDDQMMNPTAVRSFAGADDSNSLSKDEEAHEAAPEAAPEAPEESQPSQTASESPRPVEVAATISDSTLQVEEPKVNQPFAPAVASISAISAESSSSTVSPIENSKENAEAAAPVTTPAEVETATTSESAALNLVASSILPVIPLPGSGVAAQLQGPAQDRVSSAQEPISSTDSEARMLEVQNLLAQKRRERLEEEKRREKENELRRRREGREAQTQQALAKEQELKNLQERIRRERLEEQATRERIRAQIAGDRAEQAQRDHIAAEATSTTTSLAGGITIESSSFSSVDETRLQIRLPGGINHTKSFPVSEELASVRIYVRDELLSASDVRDFTLAASYPRQEFQTEDEKKTLRELKLVPNAVLLVLAKEHANRVVRSGSSLMTMLVTAIWAALMPAAKAFEYINKMGLRPLTQRLSALVANIRGTTDRRDAPIIQGDAAARRNMDMYSLRPPPGPGYKEPGNMSSGPQTTPPTPQPQPGTGSTPQPHPTSNSSQPASSSASSQEFQRRPGGYQPPRYGDSNIRRLHDTKKDDEKDKATYNGNSTQQQ